MIYAIGIDSDKTFTRFVTEAYQREIPIRIVNLRQASQTRWRLDLPDRGRSFVQVGGRVIVLDPAASYFCRVMDLSSSISDPEHALQWRHLVYSLNYWLSLIPGHVINRPGFGCHNSTKPFHEQIIASLGLEVPESLTSCDGATLAAFAAVAPTVAKTLSGVRSTARLVSPEELRDLDQRRGPVHLQRYVDGADVRAHVVGDRVIAEQIHSDAVDYRGAGVCNRYEPYELPASVSARLTAATRALGLGFAGWDFKVALDGRLWCLEANPMPGYDSYDRRLGGRISAALFDALGEAGA